MDTSRLNEVKAPPHDGTPRSDLHEVVDGRLDLQILARQDVDFYFNMVVLVVHEVVDRERLVVR